MALLDKRLSLEDVIAVRSSTSSANQMASNQERANTKPAVAIAKLSSTSAQSAIASGSGWQGIFACPKQLASVRSAIATEPWPRPGNGT